MGKNRKEYINFTTSGVQGPFFGSYSVGQKVASKNYNQQVHPGHLRKDRGRKKPPVPGSKVAFVFGDGRPPTFNRESL